MFVVDLESWGGKQNPVPYMWEVILTYVPIEGGVVDSYVNGFLDCSCKIVPLPTFCARVLWPVLDWCSCMDEGALRCSLCQLFIQTLQLTYIVNVFCYVVFSCNTTL